MPGGRGPCICMAEQGQGTPVTKHTTTSCIDSIYVAQGATRQRSQRQMLDSGLTCGGGRGWGGGPPVGGTP